MIKTDDYAVFSTTESAGADICVMDSCGRYTLVHEEDLDSLITSLVKFGIGRRGEYSVTTPFRVLGLEE